MPLTVNCPECKKEVEWSEQSPFRPFCSKRCQLIDLGEWASEQKSIPCGADNNAESPVEPLIDVEEIEAMLAKQQDSFFKS